MQLRTSNSLRDNFQASIGPCWAKQFIAINNTITSFAVLPVGRQAFKRSVGVKIRFASVALVVLGNPSVHVLAFGSSAPMVCSSNLNEHFF